MDKSSYKVGYFNVIRWPDAQGTYWLVAESANGYVPMLELHPKWNSKGEMEPTYANQLWRAAELLVKDGVEALHNPHAMIGKDCGCGSCFCCAALHVLKLARDVKVPA